MTKIVRGLSNTLAGLETKVNNQNINPQSIGERNPNQFRNPFNPQILNKERRSEAPLV